MILATGERARRVRRALGARSWASRARWAGAAYDDMKLNFFNFIALPITFGIGCEYPFNIFDRSRLLEGRRLDARCACSGGAVALCSYTTTVGYGSMLFSDNQALQSFGRLAMSGEIACLVAALFFLPSLLHLLGRSGRRQRYVNRSVPRATKSPRPQASSARASLLQDAALHVAGVDGDARREESPRRAAPRGTSATLDQRRAGVRLAKFRTRLGREVLPFGIVDAKVVLGVAVAALAPASRGATARSTRPARRSRRS